MCIRDRLERVYGNLNSMEGQINTNKNKIEEISRRELQLQEEVDSWRDRACQNRHTNNQENRESINFRNYKRNPMEFLKRLEEVIIRNRAVSYTHLDVYKRQSIQRVLRYPISMVCNVLPILSVVFHTSAPFVTILFTIILYILFFLL